MAEHLDVESQDECKPIDPVEFDEFMRSFDATIKAVHRLLESTLALDDEALMGIVRGLSKVAVMASEDMKPRLLAIIEELRADSGSGEVH